MSINIASLLQLARFFLRTPKERVEIDFAKKGNVALTDILALPSVKALLAAVPPLIEAEGWTTVKDAATGAVVAISPPEPVQVGGRPSGTNRGGLMPPGT